MAVTMREVAKAAGVSPVVVSKVLHGRASTVRVSPKTADRVREVATELGYRCNVFARNFRQGQTQMIGILHGIGFSPPALSRGARYFAALMDGFLQGAFEHGYSLTLCPKLLGNNPSAGMSDGRFDGMVWYSTAPSDENRKMLLGCNVPLVLIHTPAEWLDCRFPTVRCDNSQGIGLALNHLWDLGHRRIAFAHDEPRTHSETFERLLAFKQLMLQKGTPVSDSDVLVFSDEGVTLNDYLSRGPRHTAIIAHHDGIAAKVIDSAASAGIRVPEELSVVGFDSTDFCNEVRPGLTSIAQPLVTMGAYAIGQLVRTIRGDRLESPDTVFPCSLDIRDSTTVCLSR